MAEKITINLEPVDLGKIDLLVEQGLYSNRTDLIRTAIRNQIEKHDTALDDFIIRKSWVLGVEVLTASDLERWVAKGERKSKRIIGMLSLGSDVTPDLALEAFESVSVRGVFRAPERVKEALLKREAQGLERSEASLHAEKEALATEVEALTEEVPEDEA